MTYMPALRKYIMCVSTPTFSPSTVLQFDTYMLESDTMTGPFSLVTYLSEVGQHTYPSSHLLFATVIRHCPKRV